MAKLTTKGRKGLKKSQFAGPDKSFPIPDKAHAGNAKARASQAVKAGRMSKSEESRIDTKANKVLGKSGNKPEAPKAERHKTDRGNFTIK